MNTVPELIEDIKNGKMVILLDDEDRENEGDLVIAADHINAASVNFMATQARGLICLSLAEEQTKRLGLSMMIKDEFNNSPHSTAFTVSIEASSGVTTGISAADRAHTMRVASDPQSTASDIMVPGHVFPIKARKGGVLKRAGHTEASVDLATLAGCNPAAAICEIMNPDGTMARVPELKKFAKEHQLKIGTIEALIQYRSENESFVKEKTASELNSHTVNGFNVHVFLNKLDQKEHMALVHGSINPNQPTLVRMHRGSILGDVFGCSQTDSRADLLKSLKMIEKNKSGVLVYLRQDDMSPSLTRQVDTIDNPAEMKKVDQRDYGVGAQILRSLGVKEIQLISNSPKKLVGLKGYGLEIVEAIPLQGLNETSPSEVVL